ncbi:MAG: CatB-related O-acetyltransferase [Sporomusaceae bacterium]|nr:CatB-related O-acetyltransferase [Sporomusaceae bacterium]
MNSIQISAAQQQREVSFTNGEKEQFPLLTIGSLSYINGLDIQSNDNDEVWNIHIGNYSSFADEIQLVVNRNHDISAVTSSPAILHGRMDAKQKGQIIIGHDVWIGHQAMIFSGVTIGNGSVIGARAVVRKDVPPYAIVLGNPARIVKYRFSEEQITKLLAIQWWNWPPERIEQYNAYFTSDINAFIDKFYEEKKPVQSILQYKKKRSILLVPDFDQPYSIWEKVVKEYTERFTSEDEVTLILWVPKGVAYTSNLEELAQVIAGGDDTPDIVVVNDLLEDKRALFVDVDYFIPTRSLDSMEYIDYANEFNVEILSGVDIPIFNRTVILNK